MVCMHGCTDCRACGSTACSTGDYSVRVARVVCPVTPFTESVVLGVGVPGTK